MTTLQPNLGGRVDVMAVGNYPVRATAAESLANVPGNPTRAALLQQSSAGFDPEIAAMAREGRRQQRSTNQWFGQQLGALREQMAIPSDLQRRSLMASVEPNEYDLRYQQAVEDRLGRYGY